MKTEATPSQLEVCTRFGISPEVPSRFQKVGIALQSLSQLPLHAVRLPPEKGTCGWYIWGGEHSEHPDFYQPLHVEHLAYHCPKILPYLALGPGWRVLLAPDYEDVWYDDKSPGVAQQAVQADSPAFGGSAA